MSGRTQEARGRFGLRQLQPEIRLTLLLFAFSFFISGVPRVYTQTAAHTLFLEAYGADAMPYAYIAEALCVPAAGYLYLWAERYLGLRALTVGTLLSQIIVLLFFRIGIAAELPLVAGATIVYFEIEFVLSSLLLWGLANQLMTLRQGKRLFGFISAGEPVAIIVCGLSTPLLLRWLSAADLFLLSAGGAAIGIVLALHVLSRFSPPDEPREEEGDAAESASRGPTAWWKDRYIVTMVALVLIGQMGYFFVDNAFYMEAGKRYPDEESLASFLGVYSAVMGVVSLVCSVMLAPWILRRFGVRGGLMVLPGLLLVGTAVTVISGWLGAPSGLLFFMIVGNKVIDQSFRYTLDKTTFVTLFQPLPAAQRNRVQAGLESIVEPLAGGLAGILLFVMLKQFGVGALGITVVILLFTIAWVAMVSVQYRGYVGSLRAALAGRSINPERISIDDTQSLSFVRQGLASSRAGEVIYCLTLLEGAGLRPEPAEIRALLVHPSREVRIDVARRVESGRLVIPADDLIAPLHDERDDDVRAALVEALCAAGDDAVPLAEPYLDDPGEIVRRKAYAGLIRHGGVEGVLAVGPRLLDDIRAPDSERRRFAATVMNEAGSSHFYRPLLGLLQDKDVTVARAALAAAGAIGAPRLWPGIVEALSRPDTEAAAIAAAGAIGEPLLPDLEALRTREDTAPALRYAIVAIYGRMAIHAADERLYGQLRDPRREVRSRVLRMLWRRRFRARAEHYDEVRALLAQETAHAAVLLGALQAMEGDATPAVDLLLRALRDEVRRSIENCFSLLAMMLTHVDVHEARTHYERGGAARRAYVIEMLDNVLDLPVKRHLFPLIEPESPREAGRKLSAIYGTREASREVWLERLAHDDADAVSPLVRGCALYALAALGGMPRPAVGVDEVLVREIRAWVQAGCRPLKERDVMMTIEKLLVLRSVTLFTDVREQYLADAAASAAEVRLEAGQPLFREGEFGTSLYVIVYGRLAVEAGGRRVAELGEREVVGEMAALDPESRSASVMALEETLLLRLTNEDLELLMSDNVEIARAIIQTLCRRLRGALAGPGGGAGVTGASTSPAE